MGMKVIALYFGLLALVAVTKAKPLSPEESSQTTILSQVSTTTALPPTEASKKIAEEIPEDGKIPPMMPLQRDLFIFPHHQSGPYFIPYFHGAPEGMRQFPLREREFNPTGMPVIIPLQEAHPQLKAKLNIQDPKKDEKQVPVIFPDMMSHQGGEGRHMLPVEISTKNPLKDQRVSIEEQKKPSGEDEKSPKEEMPMRGSVMFEGQEAVPSGRFFPMGHGGPFQMPMEARFFEGSMPMERPQEEMPMMRPEEEMPMMRPQEEMPMMRPQEEMPMERPQEEMPMERPQEEMPLERQEEMLMEGPQEGMMTEEPEEDRPMEQPEDEKTDGKPTGVRIMVEEEPTEESDDTQDEKTEKKDEKEKATDEPKEEDSRKEDRMVDIPEEPEREMPSSFLLGMPEMRPMIPLIPWEDRIDGIERPVKFPGTTQKPEEVEKATEKPAEDEKKEEKVEEVTPQPEMERPFGNFEQPEDVANMVEKGNDFWKGNMEFQNIPRPIFPAI